MGVSFHASLILGVPVFKDMFFLTQGSEQRCKKDHLGTAGAGGFCSQDGTPFRTVPLEIPKPTYVAYCDQFGLDPEEFWTEEPWRTTKFLGFYKVSAYRDSESFENQPKAFGLRLWSSSEHSPSPHPISLTDLEAQSTEVSKHLALLGLPADSPLLLFPTSYVSY